MVSQFRLDKSVMKTHPCLRSLSFEKKWQLNKKAKIDEFYSLKDENGNTMIEFFGVFLRPVVQNKSKMCFQLDGSTVLGQWCGFSGNFCSPANFAKFRNSPALTLPTYQAVYLFILFLFIWWCFWGHKDYLYIRQFRMPMITSLQKFMGHSLSYE